MRNKKAKQLRKFVYQDNSPRYRNYQQLPNGQVISDELRYGFKKLKKVYYENKSHQQDLY